MDVTVEFYRRDPSHDELKAFSESLKLKKIISVLNTFLVFSGVAFFIYTLIGCFHNHSILACIIMGLCLFGITGILAKIGWGLVVIAYSIYLFFVLHSCALWILIASFVIGIGSLILVLRQQRNASMIATVLEREPKNPLPVEKNNIFR